MTSYLSYMVKIHYEERDYTDDLMTLALGTAEEAGEIAKAVNAFHNPKFKLAEGSSSDTLEHELIDCLICLVAMGNSLGINLITKAEQAIVKHE